MYFSVAARFPKFALFSTKRDSFTLMRSKNSSTGYINDLSEAAKDYNSVVGANDGFLYPTYLETFPLFRTRYYVKPPSEY